MVRTEEPPDDLIVVVRATPADPEIALEEIVADAAGSADVYLLEINGRSEILHGVSVFAHRDGTDVVAVLERFPFAPTYAAVTVGTLRAAGFEVLPTGANPDHYDVQLVGGLTEESGAAERTELHRAAVVLLRVAGTRRPNPAYAGEKDDS